MSLLYVQTQQSRYPIQISSQILGQVGTAIPVDASKIILVSNETVYRLYGERVKEALRIHAKEILVYFMGDGEEYKTLETANDLYTFLLKNNVDRRSVIVAFGGGVVGDLAGFVAATYMRGLRFIQVPTTLLAQVDSSVGGKTAVNHPMGKNLIGAFYQPMDVIIDIDVLKTLPQDEISSGLAEVIKYGLILSPSFFEWCEDNVKLLMSHDVEALDYAITHACQFKAHVVSEDEKEVGKRVILNFGHTFAHAIEAGTGYGSWLHGQAVGCGMLMACRLSERLFSLSADVGNRLEALLEQIQCPTRPPAMKVERWLELMSLDKKTRAGKIRFVLLEDFGKPVLHELDSKKIADFLRTY